jgi:hypothetical protein
MGLHDLVRAVDPSHGNGGLAIGDGVEEVLEDRFGKVCCFAGVGGRSAAPRRER